MRRNPRVTNVRYSLVMPDSQTSATVLIASPLHEDYEALRRIFDESGARHWRIRFARTCQEAWMALHQESVDVILAECDFPEGLGWKQLLDEVQNMGGLQPVIVTSRLADDCLWAEVLNLGAYDLVLKPFDGEETVRVVGMAMRQAQNTRRAGQRRARPCHAVAGAVAQAPLQRGFTGPSHSCNTWRICSILEG